MQPGWYSDILYCCDEKNSNSVACCLPLWCEMLSCLQVNPGGNRSSGYSAWFECGFAFYWQLSHDKLLSLPLSLFFQLKVKRRHTNATCPVGCLAGWKLYSTQNQTVRLCIKKMSISNNCLQCPAVNTNDQHAYAHTGTCMYAYT